MLFKRFKLYKNNYKINILNFKNKSNNINKS